MEGSHPGPCAWVWPGRMATRPEASGRPATATWSGGGRSRRLSTRSASTWKVWPPRPAGPPSRPESSNVARDRAARQEAKPIRLFVAVDVPDHARAALAAVVAANRDRIPGARWTRPDGWHVTLKFLGSTWPRLVDEVKAAAGSAATASERFETRLTELGVFPSARRARIVWAGVADPDGRFGRIVEDLDRRLEDYFVPEKRAFIPHLTVARLVPPRAL